MAEMWEAFIRLRSKGQNGRWLVPPELRPRLIEDAEEQGTNMTEVATQILAKRYRIAVMANGRKATPGSNDEVLVLRLPQDLAQAVDAAARSRGMSWTAQDEIRGALCAHYGLRYAKVRRTGPKPIAA